MFVFVLFVLEQRSRRRMRFHHTAPSQRARRIVLSGWRAWLACAAALLTVAAGFLLPAARLGGWAIGRVGHTDMEAFLQLMGASFGLAAMAALCCLACALLLGYGKRLHPGALEQLAVRLSSMGYAVPGTVIAVGVLIPFAWMDNRVDAFMRAQFDLSTGLLLSGTLTALVFAYVVRFLSVSLQTVESGLTRIRPAIDESARSLGHSPLAVFRYIHLPMLRGSLATALLLVFVDVLKELPTTLILRPFNFSTLAVRAHELASDERLADAALPALAIVLIGLLPVLLMLRTSVPREAAVVAGARITHA